ncbi:MAG: DUF1028 domain-containing protein [Bacteroidia bacterium]
MKNVVFLLLIFSFSITKAQHTFSIVAVDSVTGEIGSAGATCGDSIIWPGTPGAKIISEILPGKGAIHTQSYYLKANQTNAHDRMMAGDSPKQIIAWLVANDVENYPEIRQYGVVDFNNGHPRSAAYTGADCMDYKNHILGKNYAIQGNILIGKRVLDSMEARFKRTPGALAEKLMAAMQGAKMVGADSRCTSNGTSSLSAFIRVAYPNDKPTAMYLDINVAGVAKGTEPIDKLQTKYNVWKLTAGTKTPQNLNKVHIEIFPNPSNKVVEIKLDNAQVDKIEITDITGRVVLVQEVKSKLTEIDMESWMSGIYFINFYKGELKLTIAKIMKY